MSEFDVLSSAAAGMQAQRAALDVAARNVAAAEAGGPGAFERLIPRFAYGAAPVRYGELAFPDPWTALGPEAAFGSEPAFGPDSEPDGDFAPSGDVAANGDVLPSDDDAAPGGDAAPAIRYLGTTVQRGVDPDAITEMVAVLDAQRAYEANASMFDAGKRLAERTIEVGRS